MIEEIFDNIERAVADGVTRPGRWSPWVKLLQVIARADGELLMEVNTGSADC